MAAPSLPTSLFLGSSATRKTSLVKLSPTIKMKPTKPAFAVRCSKKEEDDHGFGEGRLVDENMAVLKTRIYELKRPPAAASLVAAASQNMPLFFAMGILQLFLECFWPTLTFVSILLLAIGLPASLFLLLSSFFQLIASFF